MYKFEFSKQELDNLSEKALLSDLQKTIIEYKIKDYSNVKIADLTGWSTPKISKEINKIVKKLMKVL